MSDASVAPVHYDDPPTRRQWIKWVVTGLLIGLPLLRLAWLFRTGDARHDIVAGPDTTVVTGPLTSDGFIDFTAALNERASAGVTPDNNAVVLLMQAYGPGIIPPAQRERYFALLGLPPLPEQGAYLLDHRQFLAAGGLDDRALNEQVRALQDAEAAAQQKPWTREQFPQIAELLEADQAPLELVTAASQRERFFSPLVTGEDGNLLYVEQYQRTAARYLVARAMWRLGEGNAAAAWDDLLTCHRLARLTGQSPANIGLLIGCALESVAAAGDAELIASRLLTAEQARQCLVDLDALRSFPLTADVLDGPGRLEEVQLMYALAAGSDRNDETEDGNLSSVRRLSRSMDWNIILKLLNANIDQNVAAMRLPTAAERQAEFVKLEQSRTKRRMRMDAFLWAIIGLRTPVSREFGELMVGLQSGTYRQLRTAQLRTDARIRLTRTGFALAIFEREQGTYPATLNELVPDFLSEAPPDPCSDAPFHYERTDDGFLLYSIGDNLKDEGGATYEDVPPGTGSRPDDLRIRAGSVKE